MFLSYYDDPHDATGCFDFVLANPPFNVNAVDKEPVERYRRIWSAWKCTLLPLPRECR